MNSSLLTANTSKITLKPDVWSSFSGMSLCQTKLDTKKQLVQSKDRRRFRQVFRVNNIHSPRMFCVLIPSFLSKINSNI